MGLISAIVGIIDSLGNRVDAARPDGTRAPIMLKLGSGLSGTSTDNGGTTTVEIKATGTPPPTGAAGIGLNEAPPGQLNVTPNPDGSISVAGDAVGVGVLATDAQHGIRGGDTLHALAVPGGAAGFMSGTDKQTIDDLGTVSVDPDPDTIAKRTSNGSIAAFQGMFTDQMSVADDFAIRSDAAVRLFVAGVVKPIELEIDGATVARFTQTFATLPSEVLVGPGTRLLDEPLHGALDVAPGKNIELRIDGSTIAFFTESGARLPEEVQLASALHRIRAIGSDMEILSDGSLTLESGNQDRLRVNNIGVDTWGVRTVRDGGGTIFLTVTPATDVLFDVPTGGSMSMQVNAATRFQIVGGGVRTLGTVEHRDTGNTLRLTYTPAAANVFNTPAAGSVAFSINAVQRMLADADGTTFGGARRETGITIPGAGTYVVVATDHIIIRTGTTSADNAITLPAAPTTGRVLYLKAGPLGALQNMTISGNGFNIDGASTLVLGTARATAKLIFTGTEWFRIGAVP